MRESGRDASASYAVLWRGDQGGLCSGKLRLVGQALHLDGTDRQGTPRAVEIPYRAISGIRIGRGSADRIDGRAALVIRFGPQGTLLIASAVGLGMIHEMADRLLAAGLVLEPPS